MVAYLVASEADTTRVLFFLVIHRPGWPSGKTLGLIIEIPVDSARSQLETLTVLG